jgi:transposase
MEHCVGLDVSLKLTAIYIVDGKGKILREGVVDSDPEAIAAFIKSNAPHVARIGLETGATSTWLWTELKKLGLPVICIDAQERQGRFENADQQERPQRCRGHRPHHAMWMV